jgi:hypothetical protein
VTHLADGDGAARDPGFDLGVRPWCFRDVLFLNRTDDGPGEFTVEVVVACQGVVSLDDALCDQQLQALEENLLPQFSVPNRKR